jgi:hypothetical protein
VGFSVSSLTRIRAAFAGTILRSANRRVLPMQLRMELEESCWLAFKVCLSGVATIPPSLILALRTGSLQPD